MTLDKTLVWLIELVLASLAVYRMAHAFTLENGPWNMFFRIREKANTVWGYDSWQAEFTRCAWCQSFWWSFLMTILVFGFADMRFFFISWLAEAGIVFLIHGKTYKLFG